MAIPPTRPALENSDLVRPDWFSTPGRESSKLWLDKNENMDPALQALIQNVISEIPREIYSSYPDLSELYRKLANSLDVNETELLLAAGSDGAIRAVFETFVTPGDVVFYLQPTFAMYSVYSKIHGARVIPVEYARGEQEPLLDSERLMAEIEKNKPRLVCIANPNSPTGTVIEERTLHRIIKQAESIGTVVLVDEAYYPFYPHTLLDSVSSYSNLVVTRTTAKAWGLAGLRIGYSISNTELNQFLHKSRPMYEIGNLSAEVFKCMLDHETEMLQSVQRLNDGKRFFDQAMQNLGFSVIEGHGNFSHVAFEGLADRVHSKISKLAYYRHTQEDECLKGYSRFSATTVEKIQPVVEAIEKIVAAQS